jgi:hypothetical protein
LGSKDHDSNVAFYVSKMNFDSPMRIFMVEKNMGLYVLEMSKKKPQKVLLVGPLLRVFSCQKITIILA